jgi:diacylglycerol O-acyltransferase
VDPTRRVHQVTNGNQVWRGRQTHRVLVVSANMGAGHNATAAALEEEVRTRWPGSAVRRVDALDLMGVGDAFRSIYVHNVEHTPWLYEFFYSSLWRHRWFAEASKRFTGSWCGRRLAPVLDAFDPDLVLSTYPLGTSGLAWLRRHRGLAVPTAAWVSDFAPHPFWVYRDVDLTVVLHEVAAVTARAAEPAARVVVGPLPVMRAFSPAADDAIAAAGRCRVLVSCGSHSFGDTTALALSLVDASPSVSVVAVCGRNAAAYQRLTAFGFDRDRLEVLGWVDDMPALVRDADLVLTNAGGATAAEALASGVPVLMYQPIAAHGRANADLMVVSGLAELVNDPDRLPDYVRAIARDPSAHDQLRRQIRRQLQRSDLTDALAVVAVEAEAPAEGRRVTRPWPLRAPDALFAAVDSNEIRQEIGVICELETDTASGAPTLAAIRAQLAERSRGIPALHRYLAPGRHRGWVLAPRITIAQHVHEVQLYCERSSSDNWTSQALAVAGRFWADPLPRDRPAWQALLIRAPDNGGPAAPGGSPPRRPLVAFKIHHAVADGISALTVLDHLFCAPAAEPAVPAAGSTPPASLRTVARGLLSLAAQGRAPRQPLSRAPGPDRQITGWTVPVAQFRNHAIAFDARPHELMFTLAAEALGRLLRPAGLLAQGSTLRVMIPVALRSARLDRFFGNWTGALAADLPVGAMPFDRRLELVRRELRRRSARGEPQAAQVVVRLAGLLPTAVFEAAARLVYGSRFFHTVVSYLPGPREPRQLAGATVRALFPVLPLAPGVPLTLAAVTYGPLLCVGVTLDPQLGCSPDAVRLALDDAWAAACCQSAPEPAGAAIC